jgi:AcrR family transcriptional regulator
MGVTERKEREKQELRQRILEAAKEVFIEDGYDKASIRAIAERVEYSPATIYLHFRDKDELFYAVHELGFAKMFERMQELVGIEHPMQRLHRMGEIYLDFAVENPELYDLMFISRAPMAAIHKKYDAGWDCGHRNFTLLQDLIRACMEGGHMAVTDLNVATMAIWSYVHGLASLFIRDRFKVSDEFQNAPETMRHALDLMVDRLKR